MHYRTYEDCLEAVNSGRADATSMPVAFAEGLFIDHSFSNITPATSEHHEAGLSFALAKPVDTELYSDHEQGGEQLLAGRAGHHRVAQ